MVDFKVVEYRRNDSRCPVSAEEPITVYLGLNHDHDRALAAKSLSTLAKQNTTINSVRI